MFWCFFSESIAWNWKQFLTACVLVLSDCDRKKKAIQPNGYVYWQPIWFLISWKQTYPAIRMFPLEITQHCIVWVFYFFGNWSPTCQRRWWWKIFHKVSFSKNPNTQFSQIRKTKFLKSKFQKVTFSNFLRLDFSTF